MKALHEDTSSMYLCSTASRKSTSENPLAFASFTTWKTYLGDKNFNQILIVIDKFYYFILICRFK